MIFKKRIIRYIDIFIYNYPVRHIIGIPHLLYLIKNCNVKCYLHIQYFVNFMVFGKNYI